jgi:6-phosphogluconolactonase
MQAFHRIAWVCLVLTAPLNQAPAVSADASPVAKSLQVYFGTYTGDKSRGIYVASFDCSTGRLSAPELAAETKNPSFLAVASKRRVLYSVGEVDNFRGQRAGVVSAFKIEAGGKLTLLSEQPSGGTGPCHVGVDRSENCVLVANYGSGSVAALPLNADGRLGEPADPIQHRGSSIDPQRQSGPHAHFIIPDLANRFALECDLGLDKVFVYRLDAARGRLVPNDPPAVSVKPGSGPRHLAIHPNGRFVYVLNEIASTLNVFDYEPQSGTLKELQSVPTLPEDFKGQNICAEVQVHPSGSFVYASNRGHDSLAVFSVDPKSGRLAFVERQSSQGRTPRHFALDPGGTWLVAENQDSNSIVVFRVDPQTGRLRPTGHVTELGAPVCAVFVAGK